MKKKKFEKKGLLSQACKKEQVLLSQTCKMQLDISSTKPQTWHEQTAANIQQKKPRCLPCCSSLSPLVGASTKSSLSADEAPEALMII